MTVLELMTNDIDCSHFLPAFWTGRIGQDARSDTVITILPHGSILAWSPGGTNVVEFGSSITAGPPIFVPDARPGRHTVLASTGRVGSSYTTARRSAGAAGSAFQGAL